MTTVIAITVFGLFFTVFALLGPAERSKPCGGRKPRETPCAGCALADPALDRASAAGAELRRSKVQAVVRLIRGCGIALT